MSSRCYALLALLAFALGLPGHAHHALAQTAPRQDARLHYGNTVQGRVTDTDSEQEWTFGGRTGDMVLIDMRAANSTELDTYLTLLDPQGNTLVTDDDSGEGVNARIGPLVLTRDGDYTILASRYNGSGSYTLSLHNLNTAAGLAPDKPVGGLVDAQNPYDFYLIAAQDDSDQLLRLVIRDDVPESDPYLSLYGPEGLITTTEFLEDTGSSIDPIVTTSGLPYVVIVSWNGASISTPYQLVLERSDVYLLEEGSPQTGLLDYAMPTVRHFFRADAGERVRLHIITEDPIAPALSVSTLDRNLLLFSNSGAQASEITVTLVVPNSMIILVEVSDGGFTGETGQYTLALERLGP